MSETNPDRISKAVKRAQDDKPADAIDKVSAVAKERDITPYEAALQLGVKNPERWKDPGKLRKDYKQNPLRGRGDVLEKHTSRSDDDGGRSGREMFLLRTDGKVEKFPNAELDEPNRELKTSDGETYELADKVAVERENGQRVMMSWNSDDWIKAQTRSDQRRLYVQRGADYGG